MEKINKRGLRNVLEREEESEQEGWRDGERERGRLWSVATNWLFLWLRFSIDPLRCLDHYLSEYQNKSSGLAWQSCDQ